MQYYVIKFVSDLRQWFSPGSSVSPTIKTDRHYIAEIALNNGLQKEKQELQRQLLNDQQRLQGKANSKKLETECNQLKHPVSMFP
jgi:hypothetical protein